MKTAVQILSSVVQALSFEMSETAAQYLLSAVAQSAAAILAIVMTLNFAFAQITRYPLPWEYSARLRPRDAAALGLMLFALFAPLALLTYEIYSLAWLTLVMLFAGVTAVGLDLRNRPDVYSFFDAVQSHPKRYVTTLPDVAGIIHLAASRGDAAAYKRAVESLWILDEHDRENGWFRELLLHEWRHPEHYRWLCEVVLECASPLRPSSRGYVKTGNPRPALRWARPRGNQRAVEDAMVNDDFTRRLYDFHMSLTIALRGDMANQWEQCVESAKLLLSLAVNIQGAQALAQDAEGEKLAALSSLDRHVESALDLLRTVSQTAPDRDKTGLLLVALRQMTMEKNDGLALESELAKRKLIDEQTITLNAQATDFEGRIWNEIMKRLEEDPRWYWVTSWPLFTKFEDEAYYSWRDGKEVPDVASG